MDWISQHLQPVVDSMLYSLLGTAILLVAFWVIQRILPFSVRKEIEEDQNTALGIILAAVIIGISIIISTAIR